MKVNIDNLIEQRDRLRRAECTITDSNRVFELEESIRNLRIIFEDFEQRGHFQSEDTRVRGGYRVANTPDEVEEKKQSDAGDVLHARLLVARSGLRILQKAIPQLYSIGKQCLEIAGKDAVRSACAPTERPGTNHEGKPFPPEPAEFTLPPGYGSLASKIKSAIAG